MERFGQFRGDRLEPGLHFKWPWPIERVRIVDTGRIRQVMLGTADDESGEGHDEGNVVLWTNEHDHGKEYDILVAPPGRQSVPRRGQSAVPVRRK